jgi:hypothetical protein
LNLEIDKQELLNKLNYLACNILDYEKYLKINKNELDILLNELFNDVVTDEKFYLFISKYIRKTQFSYLIWYIPNDLSITNNIDRYRQDEQYIEISNSSKKPILKLLDIINENLIKNIYTKPDFKIKDILNAHSLIKLNTIAQQNEEIFSSRKIINIDTSLTYFSSIKKYEDYDSNFFINNYLCPTLN